MLNLHEQYDEVVPKRLKSQSKILLLLSHYLLCYSLLCSIITAVNTKNSK
jgi:hypothetical protein